MNFIIIDLILLVLFILATSLFLYFNKKNLIREGSLYLYKTKWGIKLIKKIGSKYQKTLKVLSYVSIIIGYILMILIVYLILQSVYIYFTTAILDVVKAPPLAPLIPYFPQLFGLESFFPPFYFIYFILAILIVATVHEFSHGIFAKRYNIKIKSTGFAFWKYFPAIFGAFVEQDDGQMRKASKFQQMSILSAGVFANVLMAILFYFLLFIFFTSTFTASGVVFDSYAYSLVELDEIQTVNGIGLLDYSFEEFSSLLNESSKFNNITTVGETYVGMKSYGTEGDKYILALYDDAPAINSELGGVITHIEGIKIDSKEKLTEELMKYSAGKTIRVSNLEDEGITDTFLVLGQHPIHENRSWIGISFYGEHKKTFTEKLIDIAPKYQQPNIYYKPDNDFSVFVKDFLWWTFLINLLVALFNMLPLGILDGGRFFYLTILGITKSRKVAKRTFAGITYFIIFLFVLLMLKWAISFFL
jgi:membrane-associated protease RseP (regulator of RpoE activity)